ncbi:MAG TPA: hypothetical protein VGM06_23345 [Polyangiaceae bacterium]
MSGAVSRQELEELVHKYLEILSMRTAPQGEAETRARMSALARRFPGALRELDDLELPEILRRLAGLRAVLEAGAEVEAWMRAVAAFHALARGALSAKRWLSGRKDVDAGVEQAFAAALPKLAFPDDARVWQTELPRLALPPAGRVTNAVFALVARRTGVTEPEAQRLVFGVPRRERA